MLENGFPRPGLSMSGTVSPQFTPKENDALLAEVRSALANGQFCGDDPKALARVVEGLADPRGLVRFNFAETLGAIGRPAIPFLAQGPARARECGGSSCCCQDADPD